MSGQVWITSALGGYMWSPNLSRKLRTALQPMVRYRQFCDAKEAFGLGIGDTFNWNIYSDVAQAGGGARRKPDDAGDQFHDHAELCEDHGVRQQRPVHQEARRSFRASGDRDHPQGAEERCPARCSTWRPTTQFNATPLRMCATSTATTYTFSRPTAPRKWNLAVGALDQHARERRCGLHGGSEHPAFDGVNYLVGLPADRTCVT